MTESELEYLLAEHCAPTLAGVKAASLAGCPVQRREETERTVKEYDRILGERGIRLRLIPTHRACDLLLVYRPELLESTLSRPDAQTLLRGRNYPADGGVGPQLDCLCRRLAEQEEFPHEVGLFLGYPPEDVAGFVEHQGREWKSLGLWKVYSDVERAENLFSLYDRCRRAVRRQVAQGVSVLEMFGGSTAGRCHAGKVLN
ncbi:MAG: DUF3793 family protein [Clostridiales bacterium]|nr:DUF3793 family protein [Clostridiales bacterium]